MIQVKWRLTLLQNELCYKQIQKYDYNYKKNPMQICCFILGPCHQQRVHSASSRTFPTRLCGHIASGCILSVMAQSILSVFIKDWAFVFLTNIFKIDIHWSSGVDVIDKCCFCFIIDTSGVVCTISQTVDDSWAYIKEALYSTIDWHIPNKIAMA